MRAVSWLWSWLQAGLPGLARTVALEISRACALPPTLGALLGRRLMRAYRIDGDTTTCPLLLVLQYAPGALVLNVVRCWVGIVCLALF